MPTVQDYFGYRLPETVYGRKTTTSQAVGIEVEIEKTNLRRAPAGWAILRDGSLKLEGREFTIPVWNNSAKEYLLALFEQIKGSYASSRCSIHIHCNVCDMTLEQLQNIIILYTIYEKPLYEYSGKRWSSNFCVPVQTSLFSNIRGLTFDDLSRTFPKYSGMHFFPDNKLGTVEFRHMAGNLNAEYINNWIMILSNLVATAKTINQKDLLQLLNNMHSDSSYWILAKTVFKEYFHAINYKDFQKDTEDGVLFTKLLTE